MSLQGLKFKEPIVTKSPDMITYVSDEVESVLARDIPVAVVIQLPRHLQSDPFSRAFTDLLLYFPCSGRVMVFEYTLSHRCDIKYCADIAVIPHEDIVVENYKYAAEISPFLILHGAPCPDQTWAHFKLPCGLGATVDISIRYDDRQRENESLEIVWKEHSSVGFTTLTTRSLGIWTPVRTESMLIWKCNRGLPFLSKLYGIKGYFSEDDDEEYDEYFSEQNRLSEKEQINGQLRGLINNL